MKNTMNGIDVCITRLYHLAGKGIEGYRRQALTELAQIIDFDGALWGTGHLNSSGFHSVDVLGVDESYPIALAENKTINPFYDALKRMPGCVVELSMIMDDETFYQSELYQTFFSRYGVERVMGLILEDESTGIVSLVSLYRFAREKNFSDDDKNILQRMMHHLVNAVSHAYFLHLERQNDAPNKAALAICDKYGLFFEAQPRFIEILQQYYPDDPLGRLPFDLQEKKEVLVQQGLHLDKKALGDLFCISLWEESPFDRLSIREKEVVQAITRGLSFKEAARELGVAPSTVSNHLYKVYRKLNISSRSELALVVNPR
ncbi:helix-turn-helix transcriptional regulator [Pseudoalteromonas denitrificans]|nr:helix-turn-helix transcriptional regulator [Pseudoalteromonas denitrificans]